MRISSGLAAALLACALPTAQAQSQEPSVEDAIEFINSYYAHATEGLLWTTEIDQFGVLTSSAAFDASWAKGESKSYSFDIREVGFHITDDQIRIECLSGECFTWRCPGQPDYPKAGSGTGLTFTSKAAGQRLMKAYLHLQKLFAERPPPF